MRYAQLVPGHWSPNPRGIITASANLEKVLDAVALLNVGAPGWSSTDEADINGWLAQFLDWMRTSPEGISESAAHNNHGTFKDLQDVALAVHLGQHELAAQIINDARMLRVDQQITVDGSQPRELRRSLSWHYSNFNLRGLCQLAEVAQRINLDLWSYTAPGGGRLTKAAEYLIPAATHGRCAWTSPDISSTFNQSMALAVLQAAAAAGSSAARAAIPCVPTPAAPDDWRLLLFHIELSQDSSSTRITPSKPIMDV